MKTLSALLVAFFFFFFTSGISAAFPHVDNLKASSSSDVQADAARDLIRRIIGARSTEFNVEVDSSLGPSKDLDTFILSQDGSNIKISGTSGIAVSMGFYYYLKYYCHAQKTWAGEQLDLPSVLPKIATPVNVTRNDRFFYYANVCTMSYTMAFWNWERWEQEIDWMALRGINLPLAFVGQEAIFQRVYLRLGFTQRDMDEHFAGPAFLAWGRMGNIRKWGGPLPQMWITQKLMLQHKILKRMRSLGMIPVLPAFAGHVPSSITSLYPKASVTRLGLWGHFNSSYSATYLLDFQDPLFKKIGAAFIKELDYEFGTDHIYNADTFNEMSPSSSEPSYLSSAGKAVFDGMVAGDSKAVWLMQGWLFLNSFWGPSQVKALVTSVPQGRMIILDLASELDPAYNRFESYYGQPFIWCMLHNFGGTMELYGAIDIISKGPFQARKFPNSTMIGIGLTPEGIHQNEVIYEYMSEHAWRSEPWNNTQWLKDYVTQRYGSFNPEVFFAWKYLMKGIYNAPASLRDSDKVLITRRPSMNYNIKSDIWYNTDDLHTAWELFLSAQTELQGQKLFEYDLVDVTRQVLQDEAIPYYTTIVNGFKNKSIETIKIAGGEISDLLVRLDQLLKTNDRFLLGTWIEQAKEWSTSPYETKLYEMNARNQITLWGPDGEIHDYASKQWSGVVLDFYKPRWDFFVNWLQQLIQNNTRFDNYVFTEHLLAAVEVPWTLANNSYPVKPTGTPLELTKSIHAKYRRTA